MQIKTKIVSFHTADSKPVKQEVNSAVILPPLVFPATVFVSGMLFQPSLMFASKARSLYQNRALEIVLTQLGSGIGILQVLPTADLMRGVQKQKGFNI